jgi:hypothetical protein
VRGAAAVPYALRQNKSVDRKIFIELLRRLELYRRLHEHVYISLGGPSLEDHKLIHAELGLTRLISLDGDTDVVDRQLFNLPVECITCLHRTTKQFVDQFWPELARIGYDENANVVVWFDYTDPRRLGEQVQEFQALLPMLDDGDVVRITVNANPSAIYETNSRHLQRRETAEEAQAERFSRLRSRLADLMPPEAAPEDMTRERLPLVVARSFALAALGALPPRSPTEFLPLSIVRYADGQQMLSITGIVIRRGNKTEFLRMTGLRNWDFFSRSWTRVHVIDVPYLTLRERLFLESLLPTTSPKKMRQKLAFSFGGDGQRTLDVLSQYKKHYRYYPHFHHVVF